MIEKFDWEYFSCTLERCAAEITEEIKVQKGIYEQMNTELKDVKNVWAPLVSLQAKMQYQKTVCNLQNITFVILDCLALGKTLTK